MFVLPSMKLSKNKNFLSFTHPDSYKKRGPERGRTADLMLAKHALYQLSYRPDNVKLGGPKRNCTSDPSVISTVLC